MPYTSDGQYFPYTADGIVASKRHQMNIDAERKTMGKYGNSKNKAENELPPYVKPRHLDPNHPMNREGPPQRTPEPENPNRTPRRRLQDGNPDDGIQMAGYKEGFAQIGSGVKEIGKSIKESMTPSQRIVKKGGENARNVTPQVKRIGR